MLFPRKPPPEKGRSQSWTWVSVEPGDNWTAWIAGPCVWVDAHYVGKHKPCRESLTGGQLGCQYHAKVRTEFIGYLPLFNDAHQPVVITVKDYSYDVVERLKHPTHVRITRGKRRSDPILVAPTGHRTKIGTITEWKARPSDIEPWLLIFWRDDTLKTWYAEQLHAEQGRAVAGEEPSLKLRAPGEPGDQSATLDKLRSRSVLSERHQKEYQAALHSAMNGMPRPENGGRS